MIFLFCVFFAYFLDFAKKEIKLKEKKVEISTQVSTFLDQVIFVEGKNEGFSNESR